MCLRPKNWLFRRSAAPALLLLAAGFLATSPAAANGDRLYLDCPCEIESNGVTMRMTAGVRSFRSTDSGALSLRAEDAGRPSTLRKCPSRARWPAGHASGRHLSRHETKSGQAIGRAQHRFRSLRTGQRRQVERDRVRMEASVNPSGAFRVGDLDYLKTRTVTVSAMSMKDSKAPTRWMRSPRPAHPPLTSWPCIRMAIPNSSMATRRPESSTWSHSQRHLSEQRGPDCVSPRAS